MRVRSRLLTRSQWCLARPVSTAITRAAAALGSGMPASSKILATWATNFSRIGLNFGIAVIRLVGQADAPLVEIENVPVRLLGVVGDHGADRGR